MTATTFTDTDRKALIDRYPVSDPEEVHMLIRRIDDADDAERLVQDFVPKFPAPDDAAPEWAERAETWTWDGHWWERRLSATANVPGFARADLEQLETSEAQGVVVREEPMVYVDIEDNEETQTPENIAALAEGLQRLAIARAAIT